MKTDNEPAPREERRRMCAVCWEQIPPGPLMRVGFASMHVECEKRFRGKRDAGRDASRKTS